MPEGMCRPIQPELLQDGFQLPLDEVVGVQATTFCAQEQWLVGIPSLDVEPQALCKLRRKSEESLLTVLRPLQPPFPPAALHVLLGNKQAGTGIGLQVLRVHGHCADKEDGTAVIVQPVWHHRTEREPWLLSRQG
jgi:hypothetical protein